MTATPLRIALVDDSDLVAAGLETLLAPYADRVVLVDRRSALASPQDLDVVLYEPMGQTSMAQSLLRDLQAQSDAVAAVYSWAGPDQLPTLSTCPHLAKTLTASQLVVSVERLAEGRFETAPVSRRVVLAPSVAEVAPEAQSATSPEMAAELEEAGLTVRESEILRLIVGGMSNREIGEELELSINSVKTYIRSAYRKMGVERRTQAVLWGLDHGVEQRSSGPHSLVG